jgi:hypothetical protein
MSFFKNHKTKRQLREEIAFFQGKPQMPIMRIEKDLIRVCSSFTLEERNATIPMEMVKRDIARGIAKELESLIKYDIVDGKNPGFKEVIGSIRVEVS